MAVKGIGNSYLYSVQNDYISDSKTKDTKNKTSQTVVQREGVSYEKTDSSGGESETISNSIGANVGKTARKIAAAKTINQLRAVMAEIESDMQEIKAGIEKGWCDETEMGKLESLMAMAQNRMGEVEDREATPEEESMFIMASLM